MPEKGKTTTTTKGEHDLKNSLSLQLTLVTNQSWLIRLGIFSLSFLQAIE